MATAAELVAREPRNIAFSRSEIKEARKEDVHPAGRPFSASTYRRHRCRCRRCTTAMSTETTAYKRRTGRLPAESTRTLSPIVSKVRNSERTRRQSLARFRALRALADRHPTEYDELLRIAKSEIRNEYGSLPGDPS